MSGQTASVRFFLKNPLLAGLFLVIGAVFMFISISADGEKYEPYLNGPAANGEVRSVESGTGKSKYLMKYSWHDPDGKWHQAEKKSSKTYVGKLRRGDTLELRLSSVDYSKAMLQIDLDEKGMVTFMGRPAPSIIYLSPILGIGGILVLIFNKRIGHSV